jgi:hypothetical protein
MLNIDGFAIRFENSHLATVIKGLETHAVRLSGARVVHLHVGNMNG